MIDGRQIETLDQIGCERQQVGGLVGVRNQVDDKLDIPAQRAYDTPAGGGEGKGGC